MPTMETTRVPGSVTTTTSAPEGAEGGIVDLRIIQDLIAYRDQREAAERARQRQAAMEARNQAERDASRAKADREHERSVAEQRVFGEAQRRLPQFNVRQPPPDYYPLMAPQLRDKVWASDSQQLYEGFAPTKLDTSGAVGTGPIAETKPDLGLVYDPMGSTAGGNAG
jgi:hypothetical protein